MMLPKGRILFVLVVLIFVLPSPAYAHADMVWSNPANGGIYPVGFLAQITLQFDEEIEASISSIKVYNSRLERKDIGDIQQNPNDEHTLNIDLAELGEDTYTVVWTVVSKIDGHSTTRLFTFFVGVVTEDSVPVANSTSLSSDTTLSPWEVGIRWLLFSAAFVIFGGFLLIPFVFVPRLKTIKVEFRDFWLELNRSLNSLIIKALLLWFFAGLALLLWQSLVISNNGLFHALINGAPILLLRTRFGKILLFRQLLAIGLFVLHWRSPDSHRLVKIIMAAGLLGSISLTSHNAAGSLWSVTSTFIDWLHLIANGAWIGGLVTLTLTFFPALRRLPGDNRSRVMLPPLRRFSKLALGSVLISTATGIYSASLHILSLNDFGETDYGKTLLFKISLVFVVFIFGSANVTALKPKWRLRIMSIIRQGDRWRDKLPHMIRAETLIGFLIIFTTAILTALPTPPPQPFPEGQQLPSNSVLREIDLPENQLKVFLALAPNWIGWNRYLIVLQDETGNSISDAERVRLRFYLPEADARTDWLIASPTQNGLYVTSGQDLILVGEWQIEIDIRRLNLADARFSIGWSMESPPAFIIDPTKPRTVNLLALIFLGFCSGGVIIWSVIAVRRPE